MSSDDGQGSGTWSVGDEIVVLIVVGAALAALTIPGYWALWYMVGHNIRCYLGWVAP